ncbi:Glu-tRNA(Gln) amidotransferase subunit GatE [Candidatus Woesearchaeota archaeon]|nr:Glu-tRNA(Gln) amidotransferase subunit GatE [Candidatus Woesearchaeota archaeon]MBT5272095.1 Glu-tRNA(Gln) amidotransferase subunit GatE [Candidatus Woesearchaeota archaeon]MBT6041845.1 Glu-tRNA(Gln) amidotransferase subunit GatE [Candidatus Woesearchaeota archaeon]MBT6336780.1 Glu-tRNA(Gln) amidotransferase subunit GatE [Candidatus Woesearchaeota archaeon]MBT7927954.1 Glu-tRNA(Gln) amidotransferase subunit GatE [Candidatus Woesearchaeota archaeon]
MAKLDYKKLGLRIGIEIHQQTEGKKLFCSCPTDIIDEKQQSPDQKVIRYLRAAAGETGEIDAAAKHEQSKKKHYEYYFYEKSCCLVEIDEEPPHKLNKDALETSLVISKMLNSQTVDEIRFMRKTVVDGSNVSGFQRTGLIAMGGFLEIKDINKKTKKIGIQTICIEEDAAKIVEKTPTHDTYNLTRLGIPLLEIATDPDMNTPEEAKECAEKLGMFLRSTGKVKRGLGTIRQDVNVSIKEGKRVEVKGAQDLKMIPTLVEYEVMRQQALIKLKKELSKSISKIKKEKVDLTQIFKKSESKVIKNALSKKGVIYGMKIPGFKGILGREICPGRRVGSELSDYGKVKAGVGGLFHSDEFDPKPKYGITEKEIEAINKKLNCKEKDGFVIIADKKEKVLQALDAVHDRLLLIKEGVIKEVRMAKPDGTTSFMRPMPGAARMYPETDIVGTIVTKKYLDSLKLPELIAEKATRIKDYGLATDLAELLAKKHKVDTFEKFVKKFSKLKPAFIAETMLPKLMYMKRKHNLSEKQANNMEKNLEKVFEAVTKAGVGATEDFLLAIAKGKTIDLSKFKQVDNKELEKEIKAIVDKSKGAPFGALMGMVMAKFQGKVDGKKVSEILRKYVK